MKLCSIPDCSKPYCGNGYCDMHNKRFKSHGNPLITSYKGTGDRGSGMRTHGLSKTTEYNIWSTMITRCHTPTNKRFPLYGGKGVTVCDRWRHSFENFLADVGPRPSKKHSIDRYPDPHGNYEPGNVRWATQKEQCNNKRDNRLVNVNGEMLTVAQLAERVGVVYRTMQKRVERNLPVERLLLPVDTRYQRASRKANQHAE